MIITIFGYMGCALMVIGFGLFGIVQLSRAKRDGGLFSGLPTKVTDADKKMLKIALALVLLGLFILIIIPNREIIGTVLSCR